MNRRFNVAAICSLVLTAGACSAVTQQASDWKYQEEDPSKKICFAMYTVENQILKLTAQLYPLQEQDSRDMYLEIEQDAIWKKVAHSKVRENSYEMNEARAWNTLFRVENWDHSRDWKYRVVALDGIATYSGTIRKDPVDKHEIVVAAFTGNSNQDRRMKPDIIANIKAQNPDLLFFSGDQSYDHRDHLYAWLLFGRQFGEIIKDRPTVCIPDDHDIGQGNLWGEGGKKSSGAGGCADGGYVHPIEYVNEVQFAQTGNLPDPYDPTPIQRGISVYYTSLNVGGVDFAIIEDRKFKSGPMGLVDAPGHPRPDLINDPTYETKSVDHPGATLLGDRQLTFLRDWGTRWEAVQMKAVLSQTIFVNAAHKTGPWRVVADLDSNGWPQTGRNEALKEIRKSFAYMIAGDQHLGTVIHHGIDEWRDAGFSFCVPSIVNYWPRSWLPLENGHNPVSTLLEHTGDYSDGFGNKLTMYAYSNPRGETGVIGTRDDPFAGGAAGYGIVRFNKKDRTITAECWPRNTDITAPDAKQYPGWPVTVRQDENYGCMPTCYLPELDIRGETNPVVQVIQEANSNTVYTFRINGNTFRPKVFEAGKYTVLVGEGQNMQMLQGVESIGIDEKKAITVTLNPSRVAATEEVSKVLPVAGEVFAVEGHTAFLIMPGQVAGDGKTPWVWYAPTLQGLPGEEEKWMFQKFLDAGFAVAGIDVGESYGSPAGRVVYSALYRELVRKRGLSQTPCLLARSRGGLMLYNWAVEHPSSVGCIAGIYPVCDLRSYPGLGVAHGAYDMTEEQLTAGLTLHNPIDRLKPLAETQVPIYHIHGDSDSVVPIEENSGELARRYRQLGGEITLHVVNGQGHNMWSGWFQCQELVDFVLSQANIGGLNETDADGGT